LCKFACSAIFEVDLDLDCYNQYLQEPAEENCADGKIIVVSDMMEHEHEEVRFFSALFKFFFITNDLGLFTEHKILLVFVAIIAAAENNTNQIGGNASPWFLIEHCPVAVLVCEETGRKPIFSKNAG